MKKELGEQILKDFEMAMTGDAASSSSSRQVTGNSRQLAEACLVVSVLEPR